MHKKQYEDRKLMALTISGRDAYMIVKMKVTINPSDLGTRQARSFPVLLGATETYGGWTWNRSRGSLGSWWPEVISESARMHRRSKGGLYSVRWATHAVQQGTDAESLDMILNRRIASIWKGTFPKFHTRPLGDWCMLITIGNHWCNTKVFWPYVNQNDMDFLELLGRGCA